MKRSVIYYYYLMAAFVVMSSQALCDDQRKSLSVAYIFDPSQYGGEIKDSDFEIANRFLIKHLLPEMDITLLRFHDTDKIIDAIEAGEIDFAEVPPIYFASLPESKRKKLRVLSLLSTNTERLTRYVLLSKGKSLSDLKGKTLKMVSQIDRGLISLWFDQVMLRETASSPAAHFSSIEKSKDPNQVLVNTFFGKADACIVSEAHYHLISELNPQIGKTLKPILLSPKFPESIQIVPATMPVKTASRIRQASQQAHKTTEGRQALTLLGVNRLWPFNEEDLAPVFDLVSKRKPASKELASQTPDDQ